MCITTYAMSIPRTYTGGTMKNLLDLSNKVALITGDGSGIGRSAAIQLAKHGAAVALLGRTLDELEKTADQIDGKTLILEADITHELAMQEAVQKLIKTWDRLDIVVANAGVNGVWAPIEDLQPAEFKQTVDINLCGTYNTLYVTAPYLKKQGGAIVVTASVNGTRIFSNTGATAYSATKAAQVAMTKMLALELAKHKVRANVICPGAIDTSIEESTMRENLEQAQEPVAYPEGRIPLTDGAPGSTEQVAQLIHFLVSDMSSHITGSEMWIDGAESLLQG